MSIFELNFIEETPAKRIAVGIDLGTTHSLIACPINGQITVLADEKGSLLLPSVVQYLSDNQVTVGQMAKEQLVANPHNTFASVKRLIGKNSDNSIVDPIDASSHILRTLIKRAQQVDPTIKDAVITVPAYFNETQRQATKEAAKRAGIEVLRLINEPTAAALAYGLDQHSKGVCLVYDLGGGTFDVSLLNINKGIFEVLATGGDTALGGDDFDGIIANMFAEQVNSTLNPEILRIAREAKETLSNHTSITIEVAGQSITFTRTDLENLLAPLLNQTYKICEKVISDAKIVKNEIDHIILVGGSTRMPAISAHLTKVFGKVPLQTLDPDQVVAIGAAHQARLLVGDNTNDILLLDIIPLSLGIEMMGGGVEKLLLRNTPIPATAQEIYTNFEDGQSGITLHIVQGERELAKDCISLGRLDIDFTPQMAGKARVQVVFQIDADGLLSIEATDLDSDISKTLAIKPTFDLSEKVIHQCIHDSIENAQTDLKNRQFIEKKIEAQHLLAHIDKALTADQDLLTVDHYFDIMHSMEKVVIALELENAAQLKKAMADLSPLMEHFAQLRLNHALQAIAQGKTVNEVEKALL